MISAEDFLKENPVRLAQTEDPADSIPESDDSRSNQLQPDSAGAPAPAESVVVLDPAPEQKDDSFKEDSRPAPPPVLGLGHGARFGGSLEDIDSPTNADMGEDSQTGRHSHGRRSAQGSDRRTLSLIHI